MNENETTPLTARTLREVLFYLENQKMTVGQLRTMLFKVDNQDAPLQLGFSMWKRLEMEQAAEDARMIELESMSN